MADNLAALSGVGVTDFNPGPLATTSGLCFGKKGETYVLPRRSLPCDADGAQGLARPVPALS